MVRVNVLGTIYTVGAALPHMLDRAHGHVVILSSGAGIRAFPWAAVYGATKAADRGFAEALRHELSGTGVSVTTAFPGEVETELHAHERDLLPDWRENEQELPPQKVAEAIIEAVEADSRAVYMPGPVRLLGLNGIAPRLTDACSAASAGAPPPRAAASASRPGSRRPPRRSRRPLRPSVTVTLARPRDRLAQRRVALGPVGDHEEAADGAATSRSSTESPTAMHSSGA